MSELIQDKDFHRINVIYGKDDIIGYFSFLACKNHYDDTLHFTDKSGTDICLECIKEMFGENGCLVEESK